MGATANQTVNGNSYASVVVSFPITMVPISVLTNPGRAFSGLMSCITVNNNAAFTGTITNTSPTGHDVPLYWVAFGKPV